MLSSHTTYGQIADFLNDHGADLPDNYEYRYLLDDIIFAFKNNSQAKQEDYYAQMFYSATEKAQKRGQHSLSANAPNWCYI